MNAGVAMRITMNSERGQLAVLGAKNASTKCAMNTINIAVPRAVSMMSIRPRDTEVVGAGIGGNLSHLFMGNSQISWRSRDRCVAYIPNDERNDRRGPLD